MKGSTGAPTARFTPQVRAILDTLILVLGRGFVGKDSVPLVRYYTLRGSCQLENGGNL